MKPRKWLFATSIFTLWLLAGCSQASDQDGERRYADSVTTALTAKISSMQDSLAVMTTEYERMSAQLDALKDSIASASMAKHKHPQVQIGGEAKGDPIRPNDPPRKEVR
jgi:Tfp pilus assembly protein PilP